MKQKLHIIPLLFVILCFGQMAQAEDSASLTLKEEITVRGTVTSMMDEQPLPGVNVVVKGTSMGTITDIDGNYSLDVPEDAILVFSFIGFLTEEVAVNNQSVIDVTLVVDITTLEEVVVVGYGEQKREHVTGSVVQIDAEEIRDIPAGNLSQALIGRLAGVKIGQSTGKPGSSNPITIRTSSSIEVPEVVLYVIDGVIYDDGGEQFNRLDASLVESISILKDAAAAVYGARASGGVVLVKTKKGKVGKPRISYSTSVGIGVPTQLPEMLSAREHAMMMNEIYNYRYEKYKISPAEFAEDTKYATEYFTEDELNAFDTLDYDWLDGMYDNSYTIRHTLNLSGGTEKVRYFVGGSYYDETGNIDNLSYSKYSVRANMEADISAHLTFTLGLSTNQSSGEEPYYSEEASRGTLRDTYKRLLTAPRWIPPTINGLPVNSGTWNPYGLLQSDNYKSATSNNTNITGALEYRVPIAEGLKARIQYSYNESSGRGKQFAQDYNTYNYNKTGEHSHIFTGELAQSNPLHPVGNREGLQESTSKATFYQLNAALTYDRTVGNHNVGVLLVYEQAEEEESSFNVSTGAATIKGFDQLWAFTKEGLEIGSNAGETGRLAYIGRLNYNYGEKYLLEAAFRYEASQKFHPDHAWGFFPSLSAGWIVSSENFFQDNISFIDFLKLRVSAGRLGNDNVGAFIWKPQYGANVTGPIFGNTLTNAIEVKREGIAIPTITWQKTDVYNVGLDFRFLDHKINFSADAYYRYGFDLLTRRSSYPVSTGINKPPSENFGEMYAKGLEIQLGYSNNIGNDFQYSLNGNISYDYHRLLEVDQSPAAVGRWDDQLRNDPSNQPGWIALGIIRTEEDLEYVKSMYDSISGQPVEMGMLYYKDIRGFNYSEGPDGKLDEFDKTIIAEMTSAPYHYGFSLGASWKGLSLNATFSGAFGHKVLIQKDEQALPTENSNVFAWWKDYWTPDNPDAAYPRPYNYGLMEQHSTFWMKDGHTLRLNNVNLSYTLPAKLLEKIKLPECRLYFTGTNMWTIISPFDHKDPSVSRAYDYPLIRSYNFGLNISF